MAYKITEIEGIGPAFEAKFAALEITTVEQLLVKGRDAAGREELVLATGIPLKRINTFISHADLFRIKGVSSQYAELLNAAGIDSVVTLAGSDAEALTTKMEELNEAKKLVRTPPALKSVQKYIAHAKSLEAVIA